MNKQDFISKLAAQEGIEKKEAAICIDAVIKALTDALVTGEKVQFVGFGSFEVRDRAEKKARNPQTGEELISPATKVPVFKAGKALKVVFSGQPHSDIHDGAAVGINEDFHVHLKI